MPEQNKPFVVTDRRKFAMDGSPRPDAQPAERENLAEHEAPATHTVTSGVTVPEQKPQVEEHPSVTDYFPPPPTEREMEQVNQAYQQTSDRLETAMRATNPGMDRPP